MSLKAVHIVFIVCSVLLTTGLGVWALRQPPGSGGMTTLAVIAFVAAVALVIYGVWFLKKLKGVSYL